MGARWSWAAICAVGHITRGFSGGSDGFCYRTEGDHNACGSTIVQEVQDTGHDPAVIDALLLKVLASRQAVCGACHQPLPVGGAR